MDNAVGIIINLLLYVLTTLPIFIIAKKSEHEYAWLAWVPIANLWLMCDMADVSLLWIIPCIIIFPLMIVFMIVLWWRIAENTNKPGWLGLLMIFPIVSIFVAYYMAFVEPDQIR